MKKIFIACLLGMGLLLPSTTITAHSSQPKRIITIGMEDWVLTANSQTEDGVITDVYVYNSSNVLVLVDHSINDYDWKEDVSGLSHGTHRVEVWCTVHRQTFYIEIE